MPKGVYKKSEEYKKSVSLRMKGNKNALGAKRSDETKRKVGLASKGRNVGSKRTLEQRAKMSEAHKGEKNHMWEGGITDINKKIRRSLEYRLWRESVFERDKFTCVWCGTTEAPFNADHIKPFALFPELRFAIDNGRTLCVPCHRTTDTFAGRIKKYSQ